MTEAERYEKSIYRGPKKGDVKAGNPKRKFSPQEHWMELINDSIQDAPSDLKPWLEKISSLGDNVPRKEKQFGNLVANSLKLHNKCVIDKIWQYLQSRREMKLKSDAQDNSKDSATKHSHAKFQEKVEQQMSSCPSITTVHDSQMNKESPARCVVPEEEDDKIFPSDEQVAKAIKKILKKAPGNRINFKTLKKEVENRLLLKKQQSRILKGLLRQKIESGKIDKVKLDGKEVALL